MPEIIIIIISIIIVMVIIIIFMVVVVVIMSEDAAVEGQVSNIGHRDGCLRSSSLSLSSSP